MLRSLLRTSCWGGAVAARTTLVALLLLTVAGVVRPQDLSAQGTSPAATSGPRSSPTRLIRTDIEGVPQARTAFQVVQLLRPAWLRKRSSSMAAPAASAEVMVDGMRMPNGLESLQSMPTEGIEMMEYMSAADATTRYGTGFPEGAILISTQRR